MILQTYFLLGFLNTYPLLTRLWENGLVLEYYLGTVAMICEPFLDPPDSRPKSLNEWTPQKNLEKSACSKTTRGLGDADSEGEGDGDGDGNDNDEPYGFALF